MTRLILAIPLTVSLLFPPWVVQFAFAQQPPVEGEEQPELEEAEPAEEPQELEEAPEEPEEPQPAEEPQQPEPPRQAPPGPMPRARPPARGGAPTPPAPSAPDSRRMPPIPPPGPGRQITMDFNDADLQVLVKFMSELTGRNFILDERVRGKVTIISPSRITVEEAYRVFEAVLDVKGFTTVPVGAAYKIIPARDAKQTGIPVTGPDRPVPERAAGYVTRLIPLKNIAAQDLVPVLTPLVSKDGSLLASQTTNTLIVTDSMDNLERLVAIVAQLDVAGFQDRYEVIPLQYATARDLAATLQQLVQPRGQTPVRRAPQRPGSPAPASLGASIDGARIIPDERTNSLIVQATNADIEQIRELVRQLDKEVPRSAGRINVIYLQHADAEEVAKVLSQLAPPQGATAGRPEGGGAPPPRPVTAPIPAATGGTVPGGPVGATVRTADAADGPAPTAELEGGVKVTADKATNSLIVTASPADFEAIRSVVRQLDIPRAQVFVEALIMEVSLNRRRELGVQATGVGRIGGTSIIGGTGTGAQPFNLSPAGDLINPLTPIGSTLGGGAFGRPITITNPLTGEPVTFPSFTALVRFLNQVTDVNVLSAPHLLTTNNKEAEIVVAQNIPFITGQTSTITDPNAVQTQIDRRDVGITLRLTPTINEGDLVRLDIFQEISAVTESPEGLNVNQFGVTTTKRSAKTSVLVKDQATIVIGGLIRDDVNATENKIPILGDIPILGYLFKNTTRRVDKTNLLIFLTPHIVRSPEEIAEITRRRQEQFQQWKARYNVEDLDESGWIFDPVERSRRGGIRDGFAINEPVPQMSVRAVRPRPVPALPPGEGPALPSLPPAFPPPADGPGAPAEPPAETDGS
ncbi:MAG TPA: type II secretion system secretin GspD [Thermodesulfobacteriota bacterium]